MTCDKAGQTAYRHWGGSCFFADARHAAVVHSLDLTLVHEGFRCVKLHLSKVIQFRGNLVLRSAQLCSHVPFIQSYSIIYCTSNSFQSIPNRTDTTLHAI